MLTSIIDSCLAWRGIGNCSRLFSLKRSLKCSLILGITQNLLRTMSLSWRWFPVCQWVTVLFYLYAPLQFYPSILSPSLKSSCQILLFFLSFTSFITISFHSHNNEHHIWTKVDEQQKTRLSIEDLNKNKSPVFSIGNYYVYELLGKGAFGQVYRVSV